MSSNPENSGVNANNNTGTGNADAITGAQQNMVLQPRQLQEMAAKFRTLLTEARNVGETTPRGKELMFQAAKIKQVYDALTLNRRRQQAAQAYNNASNPNSSNPASIPTENVPNSSQQQQQQQQQTRNNSNKFSNMIKQVLTPEENQEYEKLWQNFQVRHTSIKEKETYLKQNIDRLEQEINKQTDEGPKQQLQEKKIELLNDWKTEQSKAKVTNVNATASMLNNISSSKSAIFKQTEPAIPISENISTKTPAPVAYRSNRPTITGGSAMNASALNTPATTKLPPYEMDTQRVMSKRKLRELVKTVGIDEGDGETVIDGDVEELLLDLADDFVTNVTAFSCRLAKHRKSDNLEARDIQLHLERNWNIRIPGYSADEIRSTRKWNPSQNYNQKLQSITSDKVAAAKNNGNNVASLNTKK
ncbi:BAP_1a_G0019190.mRNA.1.CDS.1 [Saccharomyces cerevisiae]|nr:BAP_1a_G0019190.mRNA.1.CDS.1 [Saccharomyces cerevisiae]CAI7134136.1 BAP_1a_G0019190.mRNA.1.CDS.1 [Saccharomyces cerevisiae]